MCGSPLIFSLPTTPLQLIHTTKITKLCYGAILRMIYTLMTKPNTLSSISVVLYHLPMTCVSTRVLHTQVPSVISRFAHIAIHHVTILLCQAKAVRKKLPKECFTQCQLAHSCRHSIVVKRVLRR